MAQVSPISGAIRVADFFQHIVGDERARLAEDRVRARCKDRRKLRR